MTGEGDDGSLFDKLVQSTQHINAGGTEHLLPDEVMVRFREMLHAALVEKGYKGKVLDTMLKSGLARVPQIKTYSDGALAAFIRDIIENRPL